MICRNFELRIGSNQFFDYGCFEILQLADFRKRLTQMLALFSYLTHFHGLSFVVLHLVVFKHFLHILRLLHPKLSRSKIFPNQQFSLLFALGRAKLSHTWFCEHGFLLYWLSHEHPIFSKIYVSIHQDMSTSTSDLDISSMQQWYADLLGRLNCTYPVSKRVFCPSISIVFKVHF